MASSLVLTIAIILAGECGPLSSPCEVAVARTMVARRHSSAFPDDWPGVLQAYYGRGVPTPSTFAIAHLAVTDQLDPGPYFYAYSESDRSRLGWHSGDATISRHGLTLHLSTDWPQPK